jgi:hypothetical protein
MKCLNVELTFVVEDGCMEEWRAEISEIDMESPRKVF